MGLKRQPYKNMIKPKHLYIIPILILLIPSAYAFNASTNNITLTQGQDGFFATEGTQGSVGYSIGGYSQTVGNFTTETITSCFGFYCLELSITTIGPPPSGSIRVTKQVLKVGEHIIIQRPTGELFAIQREDLPKLIRNIHITQFAIFLFLTILLGTIIFFATKKERRCPRCRKMLTKKETKFCSRCKTNFAEYGKQP